MHAHGLQESTNPYLEPSSYTSCWSKQRCLFTVGVRFHVDLKILTWEKNRMDMTFLMGICLIPKIIGVNRSKGGKSFSVVYVRVFLTNDPPSLKNARSLPPEASNKKKKLFLKNLLYFESQKRMGGRTWSCKFSKASPPLQVSLDKGRKRKVTLLSLELVPL